MSTSYYTCQTFCRNNDTEKVFKGEGREGGRKERGQKKGKERGMGGGGRKRKGREEGKKGEERGKLMCCCSSLADSQKGEER